MAAKKVRPNQKEDPPSVGQLFRQKVKEGRSPLYRWLKKNYAELAPIIHAQRRPSWEALAKTAQESGQGNPSRQTIRKAWVRLEADMQSAATPERPVAPPIPTREQMPRPLPSDPSAPADYPALHSSEPRERRRLNLRPPVPLGKDEPAENDGSRLPAPLRPEPPKRS